MISFALFFTAPVRVCGRTVVEHFAQVAASQNLLSSPRPPTGGARFPPEKDLDGVKSEYDRRAARLCRPCHGAREPSVLCSGNDPAPCPLVRASLCCSH